MQIKLQYHFVEKFKIYSHQKNISSNQFFSNSFSKPHTVLAINKKFRQTKAKNGILSQILPCKNQTF